MLKKTSSVVYKSTWSINEVFDGTNRIYLTNLVFIYIMLVQMKQLVGSIITSYLGPFKSNKLVLDGQDSFMVKCPLLLLQKMIIKDPFSSPIENTLDSHHQQFGCSTMSLLAMWYLWHGEFQLALEEGCEVRDILEYSQKILDDVISSLSEITINCSKTCLSNQQIIKNTSIFKNHKPPYGKNMSAMATLAKTSNTPSYVPIGIGYSSRHFSPSSTKIEDKSEDELETLTNTNRSHSLIYISSKLKECMHSLVEKLSHGEADFTDLILDLWIKQVQAESEMKFNINGICICPVTLPCSYSTVVDGLIIKSKLSLLYEQDMSSFESFRALIIKGSILFEYVHLGYVSKVSVTVKKTAEELKISQKDEWIKKCSRLLSEFHINLLLVSGEVDPAIVSFCSSNSILVLPNTPWTTLQILCITVDESPCTYLIDCDEDNVITNLVVKKWSFEYSKMLKHGLYYHIDIVKVSEIVKPHTVILCHPSESVLNSLEHQFWHMASRLHLSLKNNQLLPGGGRTEKFCYNSIQKNTSEHTSEGRVRKAVADGFMSYFKIVSNKEDVQRVEDSQSLDEMQSKTQAWRSAMSLALAILQCDCLIINDSDKQVVKELDKNVIGFL